MNTTKKTLLIVVALTLCATALYAGRFQPGFVHEERQCFRFGGRVEGRTPRIGCEAIVHSPARRDALVRYVETSGSRNGYQAGEDLVLFSLPAGKCAWLHGETP